MGQKNAAWPASLPVAVGSQYQVRGSGSGPVTLNARAIAPVPAGLEGLAQSLIRNDCQAQLDVLIDTSPTVASLPIRAASRWDSARLFKSLIGKPRL